MEDLIDSMDKEKQELIREIRTQDSKLQIIAKPFGAYINIIDIDDIYFDDPYLTPGIKNKLAVSEFENDLNI